MKKHFLTGLAILLPLMIAIAALLFLINILTEPFTGIVSALLTHLTTLTSPKLLRLLSQLLILLFLFFFTITLGMLTRWLFLHSLLDLANRLLHRIPIFNTVYKTSQEIIQTLFVSNKNAFQQVVLVPFPHKDSYAIGLVSQDAPPLYAEAAKKDLVTIFLPTTPNPTSGFLMMFRREDLIFLAIGPEEALKYILSCGMISPSKR